MLGEYVYTKGRNYATLHIFSSDIETTELYFRFLTYKTNVHTSIDISMYIYI
jgi:hypothetical protein